MSGSNQNHVVAAVFSNMQIETLNLLVARKILDPEDAITLLRSAEALLSQAPVQGETTQAAMTGLRSAADGLAAGLDGGPPA